MIKILKRIGIIVLVAAVVVMAYFCFTGLSDGTVKNDTIIIKNSINDIGELATADYCYTLVQNTEKPKREVFGFEIPLTASKVIYSYDGVIKAGFDFSEIAVDVNTITKKIKCTLPEAKILSSDINYDSLNVYDENNNPFNAFTFEDMNLSISDLKQKAEDAATENGLLTRAVENARTLITSQISGLFEPNEYAIEFE